MGTSAANCMGYTTITQYVSVCTGIDNVNSSGLALKLYPNPNHGSFTLELSEPCLVTITNVWGETVRTESLETGTNSIQMEDMAPGIYFAQVISKQNQRHQIKFIKD